MTSGKLEVTFANGRGEALLDGQKIAQCCGVDLSIRPGKPVHANIAVTVAALSAAVEPVLVSVRQAELDSAIDQIHELLLLPDGSSPPTEALEKLNSTLRAIRAGLCVSRSE